MEVPRHGSAPPRSGCRPLEGRARSSLVSWSPRFR